MIALILRHFPLASARLLWVYLLLITVAELITSLASPQLGLLMHALLLVGFTLHGALGQRTSAGKLALGLTLAPLIRLLSLSLPLLSFPQMAWYPLVSIPLLIALWLIVRQLGMPRRSLGLCSGNPVNELLLASIGIVLGVIEYLILQPRPMVSSLSWHTLLLPSLSLLIFTGFTEEIIFRGLLQALALPALGRAAFAYVALLFAVLHIGYLSLSDVLFVFAVGIVFAYIVHWSGSILGVTLAHGLTNIMLFLIMPYLAQHPAAPLNTFAPWVLWVGIGLSALAVTLVLVRWIRVRRALLAGVSPATIRALRRDHGITYVNLSQRTGIPSRILAAIEHGQHPLQPEHRAALAQALHSLPTTGGER
ncbi:MAG TPA: CPBP family glutamic-type intramembrane protease [Herpetosiphonaceae bacterium]